MKPLVIDLYCGLGGWSRAFLDAGYDAVGFDIERHQYGEKKYPGQLVLQDVLTLHGSQLRNAAVIVASPPCQKYSYMAQPWDRAKREGRWQKWERDSPFGDFRLNDLFNACFRIQREASEAAGRYIPMIVENVKGAQPWVGRAAWHYGSYYLWGDVPALMPHAYMKAKHVMDDIKNGQRRDVPGVYTNGMAGSGLKCGGDWFNAGEMSLMRRVSSKSSARKEATAIVAEIPYDLAYWIASVFKPVRVAMPIRASAGEAILPQRLVK